MSAVGFVLVGLGALTVWSGFDKVIVFDVLRSFIGAPTAPRSAEGAPSSTSSSSSPPPAGGGAPSWP